MPFGITVCLQAMVEEKDQTFVAEVPVDIMNEGKHRRVQSLDRSVRVYRETQ